MPQAQVGNAVRVHYTGRLTDGAVFDSSENREPLEFTLGEGQVIPGFENAVVGLDPGESRTVTIPAEEAYGSYRNDLLLKVPPSDFPKDITPAIGLQLQLQRENTAPVIMTITEITDETITLDANHPLAGKDLTFDIKLEEIV